MKTKLTLRRNTPAVTALIAADPTLGTLITRVGPYTLALETNFFPSLVSSIIGQQLSMKAAQTIWNRAQQLCGCVEPAKILALPDAELRAVGLSGAKVTYVKDLSQKVLTNELNLSDLPNLDDAEVMHALTQVKGIGQWTAEMFLIFSLGRPNVWSPDDAGLCRAVKWLYNLPAAPTKAEMHKYGEQWQPYRTTAALYLWEALNRNLVAIPNRHE